MEDDYFKPFEFIFKPPPKPIDKDWLVRAFTSIPLLAVLAIILKYYLIDPYSVNVLEFEIITDPVHQGAKDGYILNYEMRWRMIREGKELI